MVLNLGVHQNHLGNLGVKGKKRLNAVIPESLRMGSSQSDPEYSAKVDIHEFFCYGLFSNKLGKNK